MPNLKRQQARAIGNATEIAAVAELARQGAQCLQRIATPSFVRGERKVFTARVVGDIVGLWPGGRAILCECKARKRIGAFVRPTASCFEDHQRKTLIDWQQAGGSALVAYLFTANGKHTLIVEPASNFFS